MAEDKIDIRTKKIVDAAEPDQVRHKLLEMGWIQQRLYSADYSFFSNDFKRVCIERKEVGDLISSIGGRLSAQLYKMMEWGEFNILMIEGSWKISDDRIITNRGIESWGYSVVWNYLRTWQDRGLTIERTAHMGHSIRRVNELYAYYMKPAHTGGVSRKIVGDTRLLALQCGGIGEKIGAALLDKFGSLKSIANANIDDYLAVEKIGQKKAEALWHHFNHKTDQKTGEITEGGNDE